MARHPNPTASRWTGAAAPPPPSRGGSSAQGRLPWAEICRAWWARIKSPDRRFAAALVCIAALAVGLLVWRSATGESRKRRAYAAAIERVIRNGDELAGHVKQQALAERSAGADVEEVLARAEERFLREFDRIDLRACPPEFREA